MEKRGVLVLLAFFLFATSFTSAFEFNGTVYDVDGNLLNNTLINITIYDISQGFNYVGYNATYSNATGWFNVTVSENQTWLYSPVLQHFNGSVIEYIGQSLPHFPQEMIQEIAGTSFYLREAGTIIINAVNRTGSPIGFQYQVKDQRLGYSIAESFSDNLNVSSATIYVPKDRNYSIMIFPDMSMPVSFDWNNFSATESYTFDSGNSNYNLTTNTLNKTFNMTMSYARVNGYINNSGTGFATWGNVTIIPYMLEPGSITHSNFGTIPHNLSSFFDQTSDWYNATTGFYNISLPSTIETSEMILLAVAQNGSNYYAGFHNLSLDYATYQNGAGYELNFSNMFGMLGEIGVISMEGANGPGKNVSVRLQSFNVVNSSNATLSNANVHGEVTVDYTAYGVKQFSWLVDSEQGSSSSFSLPLLNATGVEEMNLFVGGGDYEPVRKSFTVSQILANNNITVSSFNPGDIDGSNLTSSIFVSLYRSNSTCDMPVPALGCTIGSSENMESFNPLAAIMGGGKLSFRMGLPNESIEVHYVNVDMLASGPPAALFDDSASESTGDSFEAALRFGSNGPTIYDYVLISAPYTEGNSSQTGLNESGDINISIPVFYDDDWNVIWNVSVNGSSAANLAGNFSHYEAYQTEWGYLMSETTCTENASAQTTTTPCFVNKTENKVWIRIPHFSGTGPSITGDVVIVSGGSSESSGNSEGSSSGGGSNFLVGSIKNPLDSSDLADGHKTLLRPNLPLYIKDTNDDTHKVQLQGVTDGVAEITIESDPITLFLKKGESQKVSLVSEETFDLQVAVTDMVGSLVTVEITSISEANPDYVSADPEEESEPEESIIQEWTNVASDGKGGLMYIIIVIVVIAVVAYFFFRPSAKKGSKTKKK